LFERRPAVKLREIRIMASVLSSEIGWSWPLLIVKCLLASRSILDETRWTGRIDEEARFAKRLCLSAALYRGLIERVGQQRAFEAMRRILVPIGCQEQLSNVPLLDPDRADPMERLWAFYEFMGTGGVGQFVDRNLVKKTNDVLHYEVRGCFFERFYRELGMPELTQLFCEVDTEFFPEAFPEFEFHRGSSLENTVAYAKDHCEFFFERKTET
jgi:hypothetical protein